MSNTRHINLEKLAATMTGQRYVGRRPLPSAPAPRQAAFPRVTTNRINELLDDDGQDEVTAGAGQLRFRAMLDAKGEITVHHHGRPAA